jgi:hypothetical protein
MSRNRLPQSPTDRGGAPSPELEQVLCDLQSSDDWTRANAVRALCPCRRKDWGEPVYRYVSAMRDDPSPIVRGAVQHDLSENRCWTENWEARLIQERRSRRTKVTLALKTVALADLCERLQQETGLPLVAERSVAGEKMTLFCRQRSVRDVMRQLSRTLGYAWEWRGKKEAGHFELMRDPLAPNSEDADARRVRNRVLRSRVSLSFSPSGDAQSRGATDGAAPQVKVTSADLVEALHRASGLPIIADVSALMVLVGTAAFTDRPLGELFDRVADATRMRWRFSDGEWLQFRTD